MRDGRLERRKQAGLHHRQAHRCSGRDEALRERSEGVEGLDVGVVQGGASGAASYGELSGFLQQRIELVMRFFLALGEEVEAPATEALSQTSHLEEPTTFVMDAGSDTAGIFEMGRG